GVEGPRASAAPAAPRAARGCDPLAFPQLEPTERPEQNDGRQAGRSRRKRPIYCRDAFGTVATALLHASVRAAAARPSLTCWPRPSLAALGRAGPALLLRSAAALAVALRAINGKKIERERTRAEHHHHHHV